MTYLEFADLLLGRRGQVLGELLDEGLARNGFEAVVVKRHIVVGIQVQTYRS
jgi:hypothetical protein